MVDETLLAITADIVSAHVGNNTLSAGELPNLIAQVHGALTALGKPMEEPAPTMAPAVPIRSSVKPDHIVCLEDGKKFKTLKRHLMTDHQMLPSDYRAKWSLPATYPMVAPAYGEKRKALALKIGLGRKPESDAPAKANAKRTLKIKSPA